MTWKSTDSLNVGADAMRLAPGRIYDIQDDFSWDRVRHLPVNRYGYAHARNGTLTNRAYREGERQAWLAARDRQPKAIIDFAWHVGCRLGRALAKLDELPGKVPDLCKISVKPPPIEPALPVFYRNRWFRFKFINIQFVAIFGIKESTP